MTSTPRLPTGAVTFLFTDIEGSTTLWARTPHAMSEALATHDALFRATIAAHNGVIFKTVGDEVCSVFSRADDAISAAVDLQRRLPEQSWPREIGTLRVRMGIHTGQAIERDNDYFGPALNRVARVMSIAHGGQALATRATASIVEGILDATISFRDLGLHQLKGLPEPEAVVQILAPGIDAEFPPLRSIENHPNNLPSQISSFIGRASELAALIDLTNRNRLLTIVGPGGIGKTRLSLQLADSMIAKHAGGAWFVDLSAVDEGDLVIPTIAGALAVEEDPDEALEATLLRRLGQMPVFLVLDNAEHLTAAVANAAKTLLAGCESLRILVTSREPLFVTGEYVFRLQPLSLDGCTSSESAQLFFARAHGLKATNDTGTSIDRICRRLEGIPLAIELAAARTTALSVNEIETRLSDRLALLVSRDTTRADRHRTVRTTIDWSYQLLSSDERRFARALSTFEGSFSMAAAEHVSGSTQVVDLIESLHDKSLISSTTDLARRYVMLETIAEYLREALEAEGEGDAVRWRHYTYFCESVINGSIDSSPEGRAAWIKSVDVDAGNVRAALHFGIVQCERSTASFIIALTQYWTFGGHLVEAEAWFGRVLAQPQIEDVDRAPLLLRASTIATLRSHHEESRQLTLAGREAYERLGDRSGIARATYIIATIEHRLGNAREAESRYRNAFTVFEQMNDVVMEIRTLMNLVLLALDREDLPAAEALQTRAEAAVSETADGDTRSDLIGVRATLLRHEGRFEEAIALYKTIITQKREVGNRYAVADLLICAAAAFIAIGDSRSAAEALREALEIAAAIGATAVFISALEGAAEVLLRLSLFERAIHAHSYALRLRTRYQFFTTYVWDNDARERELRARAASNARFLGILSNASPLELAAALPKRNLLDDLIDTKAYSSGSGEPTTT